MKINQVMSHVKTLIRGLNPSKDETTAKFISATDQTELFPAMVVAKDGVWMCVDRGTDLMHTKQFRNWAVYRLSTNEELEDKTNDTGSSIDSIGDCISDSNDNCSNEVCDSTEADSTSSEHELHESE